MEPIATSEAPVWVVRELHYFTTFSLYEKRGSVEFRAKGNRVAPARNRLGYGTDAGLLGYVQ